MGSKRVLIVEDDESLSFLMSAYLGNDGQEVLVARSGKEMLSMIDREPVDLILLDLNLPDEDGLALARRVRTRSSIPIIIVSVRCTEEDRLAGLELGADDYVTKPFNPRELTLRVRNTLARSDGRKPGEQDMLVRRFAGWSLNFAERSLLSPEGQAVDLTRAEFNLLAALVSAEGRALSRNYLLDAISRDDETPHPHTVDVLIYRIRNKIEPDPRKPSLLVTLTGVGYRLAAEIN